MLYNSGAEILNYFLNIFFSIVALPNVQQFKFQNRNMIH